MMKPYSFLLLCISIFSCQSNQKEKGPQVKLELEMLDSLVVEVEEPLVIDDFSPENACFLMRGVESRKPYLVDEKGTVLREYDILHERPNGIGTNGALGYRFLDKDHWVAQGYYNGYHLLELEGNKKSEFPPAYEERHSMRVYTYRTTFYPYVKEGVPQMVGEEPNAFDPHQFNPKEIGPAFYDSVKTIFNYNLQNGQIEWLETFPAAWEPKKAGDFVGESLPLIAYKESQEELALLPTIGDQLFVYDFSGQTPILKDTVQLTHRFRPDNMGQSQKSAVMKDYPSFTDLRMSQAFMLVGFRTKIPQEIIDQLKSKDERYYQLPEYEEAKKQYSKAYYLLVKDGEQVGVIEETAGFGVLDHLGPKGMLYFNNNLSGGQRRKANVFYQIKVKE